MNKAKETANENQKIRVVWESGPISIDYRQSPDKIIANNQNQFVDPTVWSIEPSPMKCSDESAHKGRIILFDAGPKVPAEIIKKLISGNGFQLGGLLELCHFVPLFKADVRFRKGEHFIVALRDSCGVSQHDRFFSSLLGSHTGYSLGVTYEHVLGKYDALFLGFKPDTSN